MLNDPLDINNEAVRYFCNILNACNPVFDQANDIWDVIPNCISDDQKPMLLEPVKMEEVK